MFRFLDNVENYKRSFDELQEMFSSGIRKLTSGIRRKYL